MSESNSSTKDVDEYISGYPPDVQEILEKIRATIQEAAPGAEEKIGYGVPTFTLNGNLVHFAAFKKHVSFFPDPSGIEQFIDEVSMYRAGKGTLQFPLDQPIPYDLIGRITAFRVQENLARAAAKGKKNR